MQMARLFFVLITLSICSVGYAKERIALVIGNADYTSSALVNSVNDAEDIASTLENLDFGVTLVKNATKDKMQTAISEFVKSLNDDTVGLFYYSGHAVQYKGSNYLIPIGSVDKTNHVKDLPKNTVNTNTLLDGLNQSQSNLNFVFLDACRDNPFKGLGKEITPGLAKTSVGARSTSPNLIMKDLSITRGVSETHEQAKDTKGILVAYSTMPGSVASDGNGRNSPYTKSLLKHITKTNSLAQIMLSDVQQDVQQSTNGRQIPILESAITGRFCFNEVDNSCGVSGSFLDGLSDIVKLELADGSSYEGQVKDGMPHGKGIQVYSNDVNPKFFKRYEGEWKDGNPDGEGLGHHPNGSYFRGMWKNGDLHGFGTMSYHDGTSLEGVFENGDAVKGIRRYDNGGYYVGEFKNGNHHGKGVYISKNKNRYEGVWIDGGRDEGFWIIALNNGDRYEGYLKDGKASGRGIKKWTNGDSYDGFYLDNIFDGFGVFTWKSGDRYEGQWKNGEKINGIFTWAKGGRYEGDWDNDVINGNGIYYFSNGSTHTGGWKNSKRHGMGVTKELDGTLVEANYKNGYPDGKIKITMTNDWVIEFHLDLTEELKALYDSEFNSVNAMTLVKLIDGEVSGVTPEYTFKGGFKNGQRNGKGDIRWKDGVSYKGNMLNDMAHGEGVRVEVDGGRYKGNWVKNKRDGLGIQDYANGDRYQGDWKNDLQHGKGKAFYENNNVYNGSWISGKQNGFGTYIWTKGDRYEGEFENDKQHGRGIYMWKDGITYQGEFRDGKKNGYGVISWNNGDRYKGDWKNDLRHGKGLLTTLGGFQYEGQWIDGEKVEN